MCHGPLELNFEVSDSSVRSKPIKLFMHINYPHISGDYYTKCLRIITYVCMYVLVIGGNR